ncbi:MAG: L-threonylcarbamoyladenylate synthase [Thermodesulfovibrionia bacterium]|nr:L-threonylcarbamoyladenylate synthase [Thermodesulfovibrionia bacterium]
MRILSINESGLEVAVNEAVAALRKGGIVAYPTESYYALGVMASDEAALKKLYEIKMRPIQKALPVIVGSEDTLKTIVISIPEAARMLMEKFWPGPLTLIFEAKAGLPELLTAGLGKVAVRLPGEGFALSMAKAAGFPITATSANLSSMPPARYPDEVIKYFGHSIELMIDAGETPGGKPSTIVNVTVEPYKLLREGRVAL